jgi:hypothetical protein
MRKRGTVTNLNAPHASAPKAFLCVTAHDIPDKQFLETIMLRIHSAYVPQFTSRHRFVAANTPVGVSINYRIQFKPLNPEIILPRNIQNFIAYREHTAVDWPNTIQLCTFAGFTIYTTRERELAYIDTLFSLQHYAHALAKLDSTIETLARATHTLPPGIEKPYNRYIKCLALAIRATEPHEQSVAAHSAKRAGYACIDMLIGLNGGAH